ncbi:MAG: DegT/DnrJ/EryC1/StrS family aminotransferase [Vicinamibacteria bacterium]
MSAWRIPLSEVAFGDEEASAVADVVRSGWVSMGAQVRAFEQEFAKALGVSDAVAVANGTAALHLALMALGVKAGAEVVVPTLSFVASANAVALAGGKAVFADSIGEEDYTIDPSAVERAITARTVGVMAMHYGGYPSEMDALRDLCSSRGLFLIEDAAHAPGAVWKGKPLGTIGDAGCFSFFGNKNLATGEGGMVLARNPEMLASVRLMRSHGMTTMSWDRYAGHANSYDVVSPGLNYRPTELTGALGRIQLRKLPDNNARRNEVLARYRERLAASKGMSIPFSHKSGAAHLCVIRLRDPGLQAPLREELSNHGIQTSLHYPPSHLFAHYQRTNPGRFPVAEGLAATSVTLPLYPGLSREHVDEICDRVARFLAGRG